MGVFRTIVVTILKEDKQNIYDDAMAKIKCGNVWWGRGEKMMEEGGNCTDERGESAIKN